MPNYLDIEVEILGIEPRIWRRFLLSGTATFQALHEAIQDAGPWEDDHLFEFRTPGRRGETIAGMPEAGEGPFGDPVPPAKKVKLVSYLQKKRDRCLYVYDFGDNWEHLVELKAVQELPEKFRRRLVGGERSFPPEDCGGVYGYYECLAAVGHLSPKEMKEFQIAEGELEERREWLGDWPPDAFDIKKAKKSFDA